MKKDIILVDTHSHMYMNDFHVDIAEAIQRALENGIRYILLPNVDLSSISEMHVLTDKFPDICFPMMGLHPTSVKENYKDELSAIKNQLYQRKYCAIGEVGIDLYWDKTFFEEQKIVFIEQMKWAAELNLPIVIHSRKSFNEIYVILKEYRNLGLKGVFHCFPGNEIEADKAIDLGFKIGIGGVVTFKNASTAKVAEHIGLEHILLETDAPYLAPHPYRGKRNESSYIANIAEKIAETKNISLEEVAKQTTQNALELFKI